MMRVACVQSFPVDYCIDFVNAISASQDVLFIARDRDIVGRESFIDPRVEVVSLTWPRHRSLANINLLRRMAKIIKSHDVDLVHFLGDDVTWLNFLPFLIAPRPVIITVHDAYMHPGDTESLALPDFMVEQFFQRGTRLIVHGESILSDLVKRSGRSPDIMDIIPHVALHRYAEIARRQGLKPASNRTAPSILFFGRVMAYKGLPHLLQATELAKQAIPALELVVAGRGPTLDELRPELGADHITLHDRFVPDEEVAQLFLDTDLIVLPYVEASQSGVLALASAFGKPVLVTDVGELGEIVRATEMGLIVPPSDPKALSAAICRVLTEPGLAKQLGEASAGAGVGDGLLAPDYVAAGTKESYEKAMASTSMAWSNRRAG